MSDLLQTIRDLQLRDREQAESLLLSFMQTSLALDVTAVRLTPKPTSLNSFNGFVILRDGSERFFKTHTETNTIIREYYNAELLASAGYPVVQPVYQSTQVGQQILLYHVIEDPAVFDMAWDIETGARPFDSALTDAQHNEDKALFDRYAATLRPLTGEENQQAPVHQLFWHRLVHGRLRDFYSGSILLPDGTNPASEVFEWRWIINGQRYEPSLRTLIDQAVTLLSPDTPSMGIIGHGDAHNGNVFFRERLHPPDLLYFDPAFAGVHDPLLDLVKPLFHNVFAMWMYFPEVVAQRLHITLRLDDRTAHVDYDYPLHPVRLMFLHSKMTNTLLPTLQLLARRGALRADWRAFLKAALMCCPLLTMNLADGARFSSSVSLLGLVMSVEMGAESSGVRSLLDTTLDQIETFL